MGAGVVVVVVGVEPVVAALKGESLFPPSEKGLVAGLLNIPDPKTLVVPVVFEVMLIESCGSAVA